MKLPKRCYAMICNAKLVRCAVIKRHTRTMMITFSL